MWSPSRLNTQPFSAASASAVGVVVDRSDELGRIGERRVVGVDLDHREDRGERHLGRQQVAELLLDQVADHPLGLGAEHVERVRLDVRVGRGLEREQADLGAVAVRQHELVLLGDRGQRPRRRRGRSPRWTSAVIGSPRFEQGVAAEGDQDSHRRRLSSRAWRRAAP